MICRSEKLNFRLVSTIVFLTTLFVVSCKSGSVQTKSIEVDPIFDLNSLYPKINIQEGIISLNYFSIDEDENFYFLDIQHHRILKFNNNGRLLYPIGSIGQEKEDLFNPTGIYIYNNLLYILNNAGRELKIFTIQGKFISGFEINNSWASDSLCVKDDLIYISFKDKDSENYNDNKLISVYNHKGELIQKFGSIIKCNSHVGYRHFNAIYMNIRKNRIFGAFRNRPILFSYDISGDKKFIKNIKNFKLDEIQDRIDREKDEGFDTPSTIKKEYSLRIINFCSGFDVGTDMEMYYVLNSYRNMNPESNRCYILHLDKKGNLIEKIIPKAEGITLRVSHLFIDSSNVRYGIGSINSDKVLLFKF